MKSFPADLQSCMICVARRVTAMERTESFNTRHELSGEYPKSRRLMVLHPRLGSTHPSLRPAVCPPRQVNWFKSTRRLCERRCVRDGRTCWGVASRCSCSTATGSPFRTNATTMRVGHAWKRTQLESTITTLWSQLNPPRTVWRQMKKINQDWIHCVVHCVA